jgi:hypothetical protein
VIGFFSLHSRLVAEPWPAFGGPHCAIYITRRRQKVGGDF